MHQNSISTGAPPQTPLGKLTALPQIPLLDLRGLLLRGGQGMEGERKGRGGEEERGGGEGRGEGGERRGLLSWKTVRLGRQIRPCVAVVCRAVSLFRVNTFRAIIEDILISLRKDITHQLTNHMSCKGKLHPHTEMLPSLVVLHHALTSPIQYVLPVPVVFNQAVS